MRLYNNLILLFEENKINYSRCDVEQSMVIDFSSGKVYKCSQNENSIVGIIEKDKIKKFTNKCDAYRMKSTYAIKQCQQCGLVNFCFHGCANTIVDYDNCQIEVYDNLHYLLDNLDIFFDIEIE